MTKPTETPKPSVEAGPCQDPAQGQDQTTQTTGPTDLAALVAVVELMTDRLDQLADTQRAAAANQLDIVDVLLNHEKVIKKLAPWATRSGNPNSLLNKRSQEN